MGKRLSPPMWFKESFAAYRAQRVKGDASVSQVYELVADDVQSRHQAGDPFGRSVWVDYITGYDSGLSKAQADAAAEEWAQQQANGFLQTELFPRELLEKLGLPTQVELGWGKRVPTADLDYDGFEKAIIEVERKEKSWEKSLGDDKAALKRGQALVPRDNSKTLRQVVADPEDYGYDAAEQ